MKNWSKLILRAEVEKWPNGSFRKWENENIFFSYSTVSFKEFGSGLSQSFVCNMLYTLCFWMLFYLRLSSVIIWTNAIHACRIYWPLKLCLILIIILCNCCLGFLGKGFLRFQNLCPIILLSPAKQWNMFKPSPPKCLKTLF